MAWSVVAERLTLAMVIANRVSLPERLDLIVSE